MSVCTCVCVYKNARGWTWLKYMLNMKEMVFMKPGTMYNHSMSMNGNFNKNDISSAAIWPLGCFSKEIGIQIRRRYRYQSWLHDGMLWNNSYFFLALLGVCVCVWSLFSINLLGCNIWYIDYISWCWSIFIACHSTYVITYQVEEEAAGLYTLVEKNESFTSSTWIAA